MHIPTTHKLKRSFLMQMLDRISEVQMAHNRTKTAAMHELLDKTGALRTDQASTLTDACTDDL
jgi:hypothetical protein